MIGEGTLLAVGILLSMLYVFLGLKKPGIALITVPITCSIFVLAAFSTENEAVMFQALLLAPVILLAALVAILLSRREPGWHGHPGRVFTGWKPVPRWPQKLAKWLLISFAVLLFLVTTFFALASLPSIGFLFLILFFCTIGFIGALISYGLTSRHATAAYVISTIGSSMRQNLPLPMALESAAGGRTDGQSIILQRIQKWLVQGYSLSESIKRGYPKCPSYAVAMIAAAERINQLPFAMKSIEADIAAKAEEGKKVEPVHPFYPMILVVLVVFVVWGVLTLVMPNFSSVLTEMTDGMATLPAATRFLIHIVEFVAYKHGLLFLILWLFVVLVVIPVSIRIRFRPRRPHKPHLYSRIGDFIKWHLPILHWFEKNYSMVQVVEMLRLSLNAGCTVNDAIANTLGLDVNNCFRKRLQRWLARVQRGDNIALGARESELGTTLAWAFDEKVNQGNTIAILELLESFHRSNYSYRVNLARFIMWPCVTLIMAAIVGFVVYAIYSAPVAIIHCTADIVYP